MDASLTDTFGPPISTYTRAEALDDGVLVDISATAREAGIRFPVALTATAYEDCVAWAEADNVRKRTCQDEGGRLWDVVWMARMAIRRAPGDAEEIEFQILRVPRKGRGRTAKLVRLIAKCGPGDDFRPVITIDLAG